MVKVDRLHSEKVKPNGFTDLNVNVLVHWVLILMILFCVEEVKWVS